MFRQNWKIVYILKMILQPVIENSIVHGLREKEGEKKIRVEALRDPADERDAIQVLIDDNGIGFPAASGKT